MLSSRLEFKIFGRNRNRNGLVRPPVVTFLPRRAAPWVSQLFRKQASMRRIRTVQALLGTAVMAGGIAMAVPAAQAVSIPVACSENALVAAVTLANSTPAPDTLVLTPGCTYAMTASHGGPANALPVITTSIELIGPATMTRASLLPFRIAEVRGPGGLTLTTGVAFTNGGVVGNGGAILNHGAVTLTGSSLTGNTATGSGGGLANIANAAGPAPAATFTGSSVTGNTALGNGGGIYNGPGATLTTTSVQLADNTATRRGGGLAAITSAATTLTSTTVTGNQATTAGGVYRQDGVITVTTSPITANAPNNCVGSSPPVPACAG
jgi:hypothetical protein